MSVLDQNGGYVAFAPASEASILGGVLLANEAFDRVAGRICRSDFYTDAHQRIWAAMERMAEQRQPIDCFTLADVLEQSGDLKRAGGLDYLMGLAGSTPSAATIGRYAEIVIERRQGRDLMTAASDLMALAQDGGPIGERMEQAQNLVMRLAEKASGGDPESVADIAPRVLEDIQARLDAKDEISGLATGFTRLDALTTGLQPGDLVIIAGRPAMGKTTLAINIAEFASCINDKTCLIFSLEMGKKQLVERILASQGRASIGNIRNGKTMNEEDFERLSFALRNVMDRKLFIDDSASPSVMQMAAKARRLKRRHGLDLIVVDYIQLMQGQGHNRVEEISGITRGLKLLARDLGVPVIALSQLSRKVEERPNKRPMLSDLRDSGSIEQDADIVGMVYRDEYYNEQSADCGLAELNIVKHRMGETGLIPLEFLGHFCKFSNTDRWPYGKTDAAESHSAAKKSRGMSWSN